MSIDDSAEPGPGDVTLALTPSTIDRLAEPRAAVADAGEWSHYVGVLGIHRGEVDRAVGEGVRQDFALGDRDVWLAARDVRAAADTPRYVLVGTEEEHERIATHTGWEFVHVTEAAEKAGWALSGGGVGERSEGEKGESGLLGRVRALLPF